MASKNKSSNKKGIVKPKPISESAAPANPEDLNSKFEVELCWCIQQLELLLAENKLNPTRAKDSIKALNVLKNNSQPIIKKRQIMNLTFGDYRSKMAEEEKKLSKVNQQIKFTDKPNKNSVFVKKSSQLTGASNFKFNFPVENVQNSDPSEDKNIEATNLEIPEKDNTASANKIKFVPSGNTFRFNFSDDNEVSVS